MFCYEPKKKAAKNNTMVPTNHESIFAKEKANIFGPMNSSAYFSHSSPYMQSCNTTSNSAGIIQRKTADNKNVAKDTSDSPQVSKHTYGGKSLPSEVQAKMEHAFNTDFSQVRVHTDNKASAIDAMAYTQGNNIHVAPEHYQPHTGEG